MNSEILQQYIDRSEIIDTVVRFAYALDMKDWSLCRSCFTDLIEADYSDLRKQPATTISADEFIALRQQGLNGLQTHHQSTNHLVTNEGDSASCISCAMIHRFRTADQDFFDTYGYYTHTLIHTSQGWKICKVKQTVLWNRGNPKLHGANLE